jgi:hypothetical protein
MKLASDALKHLLGRMVCHSSPIPWPGLWQRRNPFTCRLWREQSLASDFRVIRAPPSALPFGLPPRSPVATAVARSVMTRAVLWELPRKARSLRWGGGIATGAGAAALVWTNLGASGKDYLLAESFGNAQKCPRSVQASYLARDDETT